MSGMRKKFLTDEKQLRLENLRKRIGNDEISSEAVQQKEIINLLHELNEIKDSTQIILGILAKMEGVTIKEMHLRYKLPLD